MWVTHKQLCFKLVPKNWYFFYQFRYLNTRKNDRDPAFRDSGVVSRNVSSRAPVCELQQPLLWLTYRGKGDVCVHTCLMCCDCTCCRLYVLWLYVLQTNGFAAACVCIGVEIFGISTFRDWFRRIRMRPRVWQSASLPHCPVLCR